MDLEQACFVSQDPSLPPNNTSSSNASASIHRRRRRRTSPHDQGILEEEYRKCTKPDKAQRKEICKLVQMGEKEVQVVIPPALHPSFCIATVCGCKRTDGRTSASSGIVCVGGLGGIECGVDT